MTEELGEGLKRTAMEEEQAWGKAPERVALGTGPVKQAPVGGCDKMLAWRVNTRARHQPQKAG